jgi:hypothetical protein
MCVTGVQRQVIKHGVLCMLEAELSESLLLLRETFPNLPALPDGMTMDFHERHERHTAHFFQASVLAMLEKGHQCDTSMVSDITNTLLDKYGKAPATVRYRLVERMFTWEFQFAPIDCFTWLAKMGVLKSNKHPGQALEARYSLEFLQRLALLCEFEMLCGYIRRVTDFDVCVGDEMVAAFKEDLSEETKKLLLAQDYKVREVKHLNNLKHSFPIVSLIELENSESIQHFFSNLNTYATRFRVFQGELSSWIGMLCGGFVEVMNRNGDQNKPIYSAEFNEGSVTECISKGLSKRGFEITARVIYERHRDFKETILKIVTAYYNMKLVENVAIPPELNDLTYHGIIPHWGQLKPKPRRNPRSRA